MLDIPTIQSIRTRRARGETISEIVTVAGVSAKRAEEVPGCIAAGRVIAQTVGSRLLEFVQEPGQYREGENQCAVNLRTVA